MKYKFLSEEMQEQIRQQTVNQIEAEHYSTTLALERATASGESTEALQARIDALEAQHKALSA